MNDYMKALHQRFFREPAYPEIRREASGAAGKAGPAGPGIAAEAGGPGHRTAGGDLPGVLHRRVPAGAGDRRRTDALLLRGRRGGARPASAGAGNAVKMRRYIKEKNREKGPPEEFLTN